jgi:hypothetical protein
LLNARNKSVSYIGFGTDQGRHCLGKKITLRSNLCILFHIADDGLPTLVHMNMLDADNLLTAITQASKDLNLHCISPH